MKIPDFEGTGVSPLTEPGELLVEREFYLPRGNIVSLSTINKNTVDIGVYGEKATWFDPDHDKADPTTGMLTVHETVAHLSLRWQDEDVLAKSIAKLTEWRDQKKTVNVTASVEYQAVLIWLTEAETPSEETVVGISLGQERMDRI